MWDFGFQSLFFVRRRVGEQIISACVVPTVKHGGGGVMVLGGALLVTLSVIYLEFKAHFTSMATTAFCSDTPSHLVSTGQWPNTPPGCIRAIWPRRVMEGCIRWPGLHNHRTSTQLRWFKMSWPAEWIQIKSSQQVLSICGNSFKTAGKAFQVKLVERMPRVCKAVINAKGGYFEESQI